MTKNLSVSEEISRAFATLEKGHDVFVTESKAFIEGKPTEWSFAGLLRLGILLTAHTHRTLARDLQVMPSTVARWENCQSTPLRGMQIMAIKTLRKYVVGDT